MSCDSDVNKCTFAARISGGLTRLAAKAAYYTGLDQSPGWPRRLARSAVWTRQGLAAAGVAGAVAGLGYALIRTRKKKGPKYGGGVTMLGYYPHAAKFNLAAGQRLTRQFGGALLPVKLVRQATGPDSRSLPLIKAGGEDDVFLMSGPNGDIHYMLPDNEETAMVVAIIPHKKDAAAEAMRRVLEANTPKFVLTDRLTGQEYATRDRVEALRFGRALGQAGQVALVQPGQPNFAGRRRYVPPGLLG